jgi:predicted O-methyltransferase YrrM
MKSLIRKIFNIMNDRLLRVKYGQLNRAFKVVSHLTIPERVMLYKLTISASTAAEIGSYIGASTCCFGAALKEQGVGKLICIDTWKNHAMSEGNRDTWAEFLANTVDYKEYILPVRGFSTDVVNQVLGLTPQLDVLFIDGDHSYEGVKADWDAYKSFLEPGSIVIFHDYGWADGVKKVVREDVMPLMSDYDRLPNMWWGTLLKNP